MDYEKTLKEIEDFILYKAGHLLNEETEHRFIKFLEKQKDEAQRQYNLGVQAGMEEVMYELEKEQKIGKYPLCETIKDKIKYYIANHFIADRKVTTDIPSIVHAMEEGVRLGKEEQKPEPNVELIKKSWYRAGYIDREFNKEPMWILENLQYKENPKYGQMLEVEQKPGTTKDNPIDPFDTKLFQDGVKEGRRLEREDMLKGKQSEPFSWGHENGGLKAKEESK